MHNKILAVLLAWILMLMCAVNASAAEEEVVTMPDLSQKGSLTFVMDINGESLNGGNLNLYYVASVTKVKEKQYDFQLLNELTAVGAKLNTDDLYDSAQAQELLGHAQNTLDQYWSLPIEEGKVQFNGLEPGLYLVWQRPEDATEGYDAILPFLISIPKWQNGIYALNVKADPKVPIEKKPNEPPTPPTPPPPPPELPQTGQLNWPIPLMGLSGTVLLILGWILCVRKKSER